MTPRQWQWLNDAAKRIPSLFEYIEKGETHAEELLGERVIKDRHVRLKLVAQVVDLGTNPLRSHASINYPGTGVQKECPETRHRRRSPSKKW